MDLGVFYVQTNLYMGLEASKYHEISHGQMQTILTSGWFILCFLCTYRYVYYVDMLHSQCLRNEREIPGTEFASD